ncbi:MAG: hypothetical protein H6815_01630 [Phycisphaeraceae bacterium]|nr:hypothetical protein [Phycisphaerales bacterium]MCB9859128.1 hypothetical protein [Phycisphaeraceae bacterium]
MRWFVDLLVVIAVVTAACGFIWLKGQNRIKETDVNALIENRERLQVEIKARAAAKDAVELNSRGWPRSVSVQWFLTNCPSNPLLRGDRPWIEIASELEAYLEHPLHRAATRAEHATFWYNPYNGVVRARVPMQTTDDQTLRLYNLVNESNLPTLHTIESMPKNDIALRDYMRVESQIRLAREAELRTKAAQAVEFVEEKHEAPDWAELTEDELDWLRTNSMPL